MRLPFSPNKVGMMDFERSDSGLFVPEQSAPRMKQPSRLATLANSVGLSAIVNVFIVLIQLATVLILWKTYQDTVIPNRQKELLSEQVAQLELERVRRTKDVSLAKRHVQALNAELIARRADLKRLSIERQNLLTEATTAQAHAERARMAEMSARRLASKSQSGLEASQWSIYYQSAAMIVSLPRLAMIGKLGEIEREGIGADDPKAAFHTYLDSVDGIWPNMDRDASMIVNELRKDRSKFYPRRMAEEFSAYFEKGARGLSCPKPKFSTIRADINKRFDAAAAVAEMEARAARQRKIDEGLKKNIQYVFPPGTLEYEIKVAISNATYKMIDQVEIDMRDSIEKCNGRFGPISNEFFARKGVSQPGIPDSVPLL